MSLRISNLISFQIIHNSRAIPAATSERGTILGRDWLREGTPTWPMGCMRAPFGWLHRAFSLARRVQRQRPTSLAPRDFVSGEPGSAGAASARSTPAFGLHGAQTQASNHRLCENLAHGMMQTNQSCLRPSSMATLGLAPVAHPRTATNHANVPFFLCIYT